MTVIAIGHDRDLRERYYPARNASEQDLVKGLRPFLPNNFQQFVRANVNGLGRPFLGVGRLPRLFRRGHSRLRTMGRFQCL
ncbi:uncharacterized protein LOC122534192 isoform X3 [Frieseomelitta varia]|uniref:uncharacterized protein LOC122534192 isoform X3 n=1 Tax=Frieseomelitta varia TaxID=561572 RepID=UPI001CB69B84|nr:uncharacterized protein LOC122534192 isoform X3 [Frieseomelitta varia]